MLPSELLQIVAPSAKCVSNQDKGKQETQVKTYSESRHFNILTMHRPAISSYHLLTNNKYQYRLNWRVPCWYCHQSDNHACQDFDCPAVVLKLINNLTVKILLGALFSTIYHIQIQIKRLCPPIIFYKLFFSCAIEYTTKKCKSMYPKHWQNEVLWAIYFVGAHCRYFSRHHD